ncbi:MAG: LytTR family DNA-binding domain-containing protein [Bacteroidota bacterium]|nr:LytTR family DNA-binding domain-containing protein [Bacteroidota bacterium]
MPETISCMIVDDDRMSLRILQSLVEKTDFLHLVQTFDNSIDAAKVLMEQEVDLLFLDVEMPDMTGLQLMEALEYKPQIIITTSKEQYALNAFNLDAVDFLLKPVDNYARFLKAVNKAKNNIRKAGLNSTTNDRVNQNEQANRIFIKIDSLLVNFDLCEVLYIEAFGDYVKIHTDKKFHVVHTKLRTVEDTLPENDFVRVHRSYIVRVDKIKNIDTANLQVGNSIIPISNSYRTALFNKIKTL